MDQLNSYKKLIKGTFSVLTDKSRIWKNVRPGYFVSFDNYFKLEVLLDCRTARLFQLFSDRHYVTRSQWDTTLREMSVVENFEKIGDGCIYITSRNYPEYVGLQWVRQDSLILHRSYPNHPALRYNGPLVMECVWLKTVDEDKTFVTIISNQKSLLVFDPKPLEQLCKDSARFIEIYNPWQCPVCRKQVPSHELECRNCKTPRYLRCGNMKCFEAQMKGAKKCNYCGE